MSRIKDYTGFAAWYCGLGYIVLWPLTSPDIGGKLPPALHAIGFLSAVFVAIRLLQYAVRRARRARTAGAVDVSALKARMPVAMAPPPRLKPAAPLRPVKPRTHFGLRGMPR